MYTVKTVEHQDADGNRGQDIVAWVIEDSDTDEIISQLGAQGCQPTDKLTFVTLTDQFGDEYDVSVHPSDYI